MGVFPRCSPQKEDPKYKNIGGGLDDRPETSEFAGGSSGSMPWGGPKAGTGAGVKAHTPASP